MLFNSSVMKPMLHIIIIMNYSPDILFSLVYYLVCKMSDIFEMSTRVNESSRWTLQIASD